MQRSLRSWLWRVDIAQEVDEEIAFHIEMRTRELVERGVDERVAREMVLARLGDVERLKRACVDLGRKREREMRVTQWLDEFRTDVKFAVRQLKASPGFTLVAALTLGLGIGANSAMFALADATFLRPLPFEAPADRLVMLWERRSNGFTSMASPLEYRVWDEENTTLEAMASFASGGRAMRGLDGLAEQVQVQLVSARFFDVLGARPIAGRAFLPSDASGSPDLVVLSERFWRRRFSADTSIVGRQIVVDAQPLTVVGVAPAEFQILPPFSAGGAALTDPTDLWILAGQGGGRAALSHFVHVVGRLKPGVTIVAAQSQMTGIAAQASRQVPEGPSEHGITVQPLREALIGPELRLTSMLLLGLVGFVLLMCCANVASLLMSRTSARARELAVRSALGAGRRRIAVQLLTESLVLASLGALLGGAVGAAILNVAPAVVPTGLLPAAVRLTFDARVMAFCGVAAFAVGLLFGLAPAWQSTRASLVQALASDGRTTRHGGSLRTLLVLAEIATAVLVLTGAGLLLRTWLALDDAEPGYRPPDALTMVVTLPMTGPDPETNRYRDQDGLRRFYQAAQRELENEPAVLSVAWGSALPLEGGSFMQPFTVAGDPQVSDRLTFASYHMVSGSYFETMNISIVRGRSFADTDGRDAPPVCIVSEAFVRRYLGSREPIGMRLVVPMLSFWGEAAPVREIVGVARQVRARPDEAGPTPQIYVPVGQNAWYQASLVVRPNGGAPGAPLPAVRAALARVDSEVPVTRIRTLEDVAAEATARPRFRAVLVSLFALLALVLATVGVFGVLAYSVQQRTREFGLRLALGATAPGIATLVLSSAARIVLAGVAVGLAAAAALARSISMFLFGVEPFDPLTFAGAALVAVATALVAVAAPAWRAMRVDPVLAFRAE